MANRSKKQRLKDNAVKWWSWYVRKKWPYCVTCKVRGLYNPVRFNDKGFPVSHNNGHFIGGRSKRMSLMFEPNNQHTQCVPCNINHNSDQDDYTSFMLDEYGQEEIDRLMQLKHTKKSYTEEDYKEMIADLKVMFNNLPDPYEGE